MRTLVAIPVYNEANTVERVLRRVRTFVDHVLVVDDGSTDETAAIVDGLKRELDLDVIRHEANAGYGRSIRESYLRAARDGYDWVITMDCDEQHEPASIPAFIAAQQENTLDIISGSRYLDPAFAADQPPEERRSINARITDEVNDALGFGLTDSFCGFKSHRVSAVARMNLTENGYAFPMQLWAQASALGLRVGEIPVHLIYNDLNRTFGGGLDEPTERLRHYQAVLSAEITRANAMVAPRGGCSSGTCCC